MSKARGLADLGNVYSDGALSNRNVILNGAMTVAQRGVSFTGVTASSYYSCDRFAFNPYLLGAWTVSQDTDGPVGFSNSYKFECTTADAAPAAGDVLSLLHRIEGQNLQHLAFGTAEAQNVTLSFWVKSNATGTYTLDFRGVDSGRSIGANYTVDASGVWEKKTITFVGDTVSGPNNDSGTGIEVHWWLGSGSNFTSGSLHTTWATSNNVDRNAGSNVNLADTIGNYFQITGVQLEVGDTATPFEHRSYGQELALCQRFYEILSNTGVNSTPASYSSVGGGRFYATPMTYAVTKRATPTATIDGGSSYWTIPGIAGYGAVGTKTWGTASLDTTAVTPYAIHVSGHATPANAYVYRWEASLEVILDAEL